MRGKKICWARSLLSKRKVKAGDTLSIVSFSIGDHGHCIGGKY